MAIENATTMKVYRDSVPAHCQVATDQYTCVVDYLDADGNLLDAVVHDRASIDFIADRDGLIVVDHWVNEPTEAKTPTAAAAERNAAEAAGAPLPEPPSDLAGVGDDDQIRYLPEPPAANASTDDWRAYRLAQGHDPEELAGLGRNELRDDVADPEGWDA